MNTLSQGNALQQMLSENLWQGSNSIKFPGKHYSKEENLLRKIAKTKYLRNQEQFEARQS